MKSDPASLEHLHDIVLPPPVSLWPPAPGWYVVLVLLLLAAAWMGWRWWQHWQANGYRRAALRHLATLQDAPAIAELLRRTALAIAPRHVIAENIGTAWVDWLAAQCPVVMPPEVRRLLTAGIYEGRIAEDDISLLRAYAVRWITRHRKRSGIVQTTSGSSDIPIGHPQKIS
jgi:hypothetical protein